MNKYQEALNKIINMGDKDLYNEHHLEWADTLQELVDKATPKKPKRDRLYYNCCDGECDKTFIYYCSVCNVGSVEDMKYCPDCGQALDWSDEDENSRTN